MYTYRLSYTKMESLNKMQVLSPESINEAITKIKNIHTVTGGHLDIIKEERYAEAFNIIEKHFSQGEPLTAAFGIDWSKSRHLFLAALKKHLSIMVVSNETNEVMGILINTVQRKDELLETTESKNEAYAFVAQKDGEIDLFNRFGLSEVFMCYALAVHCDYRLRGLGTALVGASLDLAKELGFHAARADCSSKFAQRIFEKFEAEILCVLPYDQYTYKGKYISESSGVHTCAKVVLKQFK